MSSALTLRKAPISQAVFEVRFNLEKEQFLELSEYFQEKFEGKISSPTSSMMWDVQVELNDTPSVTKKGLEQLVFQTRAESFHVNVSKNNFVLSKNSPYTGWDNFLLGVETYFGAVRDKFNIQNASRVGVRFINVIDPETIGIAGSFDLNQVLLTAPVVAPKLDISVSQFMMRTIVSKKDVGLQAVVTCQDIKDNNRTVFALDIDVFKENVSLTDKAEWDLLLEKMRSLKNDLFFNSISDDLKEAYK